MSTYDPYSPGALGEHVETLGVALAWWDGRDDIRAQPEVRRAANTAVDEIDTLLRKLYHVRSRLISEIRRSDDASNARVDALLARYRGGAA
jgi:hypothetical protein